MIDQAFTNDVNARLAVFLQQNQFKSLTQQELQYLGLGLTQQEIDQRGITTLFWINDKLILELYSDPLGGEVNCRIGMTVKGNFQNLTWKYFYELFPLTTQELIVIQQESRTFEAQLAMLIQKMKMVNFNDEITD